MSLRMGPRIICQLVLFFASLNLVLHCPAAASDVTEGNRRGGETEFQEALQAALSLSHELTFYGETVELISSGLSPHITEHIPSVSLSYTGSNEYLEGSPPSTLHSLSLGTEVNVFDGGRTFLRDRRRKIELKSLRRRRAELENEIKLGLIKTYASAVFAEKRRQLRDASYRSAFSYLGILRTKKRQGSITDEKLSESVLELRRMAIELRKTEVALDRYRRSLGRLTGIEEIVPAGSVPLDWSSIVGTKSLPGEDLLAAVKEDSKTASASRLAAERAEIELAEKRRRLLPGLTVYSAVTFSGREFPPVTPEITFGVELKSESRKTELIYSGNASAQQYGKSGYDTLSASFPLYYSREARELSRLELIKAKEDRAKALVELGDRVLRDCEEIALMEREKELARSTLELQKRLLGKAQLLYEHGRTTLPSLLESMKKHLESRIALYRASFALFIAEYELLLFCGMERRADRRANEYFGTGGYAN